MGVSDLYYYISTVEVYSNGLTMCTLVYIIMQVRFAVFRILYMLHRFMPLAVRWIICQPTVCSW